MIFFNLQKIADHEALCKCPDYVFSSEAAYDEIFKTLYPNSKSIILDEARSLVPISATALRKNLYANWHYLPKPVKGFFVKKVLITGIESTGKSIMTNKLATYFDTQEVQEIGRDYCVEYKNNLTPELFEEIAMKHYLKQQEMLPFCNKYLFVDSDAIVTLYYLKKYNMLKEKTNALLHSIISLQNFDYVFYLKGNTEWKEDGFRWLKENRNKEDAELKAMYDLKNIKYVEITAETYNDRFLQVINELNATK